MDQTVCHTCSMLSYREVFLTGSKHSHAQWWWRPFIILLAVNNVVQWNVIPSYFNYRIRHHSSNHRTQCGRVTSMPVYYCTCCNQQSTRSLSRKNELQVVSSLDLDHFSVSALKLLFQIVLMPTSTQFAFDGMWQSLNWIDVWSHHLFIFYDI